MKCSAMGNILGFIRNSLNRWDSLVEISDPLESEFDRPSEYFQLDHQAVASFCEKMGKKADNYLWDPELLKLASHWETSASFSKICDEESGLEVSFSSQFTGDLFRSSFSVVCSSLQKEKVEEAEASYSIASKEEHCAIVEFNNLQTIVNGYVQRELLVERMGRELYQKLAAIETSFSGQERRDKFREFRSLIRKNVQEQQALKERIKSDGELLTILKEKMDELAEKRLLKREIYIKEVILAIYELISEEVHSERLMSVLTQTLHQGAVGDVLNGTVKYLQERLDNKDIFLRGSTSREGFVMKLLQDEITGDLLGVVTSHCQIMDTSTGESLGEVRIDAKLDYTNNDVSYHASGVLDHQD